MQLHFKSIKFIILIKFDANSLLHKVFHYKNSKLCEEYNDPLRLTFADYNKAFDPVELSTNWQEMNKARIDFRYRRLPKHIYDNAIMQMNVAENIATGKIKHRNGVKHEDTISIKLFALALEDVFMSLNWDQCVIKTDGQ